MSLTTKENGPDHRPDPSSAISHYTTPGYPAHTGTDDPRADKWRDDWYRRCIRAAVDDRYFDMMPLGVRLQANVVRARLAGGGA